MGEPERLYDDDAPEDDVPKDAKSAPKPEWLVSASEALESEFGRPEDAGPSPPPELRSAVPPPPRTPAGPRVNPYEGFAQSAAGRAFGSSWMESGYTGAPNERPAAAPEPETPGDFPEPSSAAAPEPEPEPADEPVAATTPGPAAARPTPPAPPRAWWEEAKALVMSPIGLIALGVVLVLVVVVSMMAGPKEPVVSIAKVHRDPQAFDNRAIRVHGKVGEVYPVGGGYTFYLLQGRDTMVVFTRSRTPVTDEKVTVSGTISTGFLNGEMRQALFETAPLP